MLTVQSARERPEKNRAWQRLIINVASRTDTGCGKAAARICEGEAEWLSYSTHTPWTRASAYRRKRHVFPWDKNQGEDLTANLRSKSRLMLDAR
jgi:hypothetical protein